MRGFWFFRIVLWVAAAFLLMALAVMLLWNNLLPGLFGWPALTYGQALGILILARLLFKGFWGGHCHKGRWGGWRGHGHWGGHYWKKRLEQKMAAMTPEERDKFKAKMKDMCGPWWAGEEKSEDK